MQSEEKRRVAVAGGGIGGMAAAALLAKDGHDVTVLERNDHAGGRARVWKKDGFSFDMGPSWYLMPEVFDRYFELFGERREDWYTLKRLDPSYRVLYGPGDHKDVLSDPDSASALFDSFEPGAGAKLRRYLADAGYKYDVALKEFLYREYRSIFDFLNGRMITEGVKLKVLGKLHAEVSRVFKDRRARQILEYPMVFLGTAPKDAPGLYSIMSHVDLTQGVYYPMGGLAAVADAIRRLAESRGVRFELKAEVENVRVEGGKARGVSAARLAADGRPTGERIELDSDAVLANADYAHVETELLEAEYRSYPRKYWEKRVIAPTLFLVYLGLTKTLPCFTHHNLYFPEDWDGHFDAIFKNPAWPQEPCFYVSCISKTDPDMAPQGCENIFLLVPVAAGLKDDDGTREAYADMVIRHLEKVTGENVRAHIAVKRIFSQRDYIADYHAWKGTSLGLSHTLSQTAFFRPAMRSKKVDGLYYAGQYTHPGIGIPMVLIAAELAASIVAKG